MDLVAALTLLWPTCGFIGLIAAKQGDFLKDKRISKETFFVALVYGPIMLFLSLFVLTFIQKEEWEKHQ